MASETIRIDGCLDVHLHAASGQPLRDFHFVVVDTHVQERTSSQRCSERGEWIAVATKLWWLDLLERKRAAQKPRVPAQMLVKQINASAMQRHGGSVWQFETVLNIEFEDLVFRGGIAAVRLEHIIDRSDALTVLVTHLSAELEHKLRA